MKNLMLITGSILIAALMFWVTFFVNWGQEPEFEVTLEREETFKVPNSELEWMN